MVLMDSTLEYLTLSVNAPLVHTSVGQLLSFDPVINSVINNLLVGFSDFFWGGIIANNLITWIFEIFYNFIWFII